MTLWISPHIWDSLTRLEYQKKTETRLSRSYENNVAMRLCTGCSATVPASVWEMNGKQLHFPLHQHEMPKAKDITGGTIYKKKKWGKWLGVRRKERGVGRRRGRERGWSWGQIDDLCEHRRVGLTGWKKRPMPCFCARGKVEIPNCEWRNTNNCQLFSISRGLLPFTTEETKPPHTSTTVSRHTANKHGLD